MERAPVEALRKGLELLELLSYAAGEEGLSLAAIAERMGHKRTTAHNLLKTLVMSGYVINDGEGRYRLGSKPGQLIRNRHVGRPLPAELLQPLVQLAGQLNENAVLTSLAGGMRYVLARTQGEQLLQVNADRLDGEHMNIWETVTGRMLAACAAADEREEILSREGLPGPAWDGIAERPELEVALDRVRAAGYAESHGRDIASLAVPVLEGSFLLGAIGVHLPDFRWDETMRAAYLSAMHATARDLGRLWFTWNG